MRCIKLEKRIYHDSKMAYLIIEPQTDIKSSLSMNMLKNNKIQCLLDMECRYIDNNLVLYYEIQGLQCIKDYTTGNKLDYNITRQLYIDIVQAVLNGEEFFLSENFYILDLEYIYWDKKNSRVKLCCIPEWQGDFQSDVKKLTEDIITYIDNNDKAAVAFIYGIYDLIISSGFVLKDVNEYIKGFTPDILYKDDNKGHCVAEYDNVMPVCGNEEGIIKTEDIQNSETKNFIDTKKYGLKVETSSLPLKSKDKKTLTIWFEDICNKFGGDYISIGRSEDCGLVFPYSQISRCHARVYIENGKLYIEDNSSTNGTYVNGERIPANIKIMCNNNDLVIFAGIKCHVICK